MCHLAWQVSQTPEPVECTEHNFMIMEIVMNIARLCLPGFSPTFGEVRQAPRTSATDPIHNPPNLLWVGVASLLIREAGVEFLKGLR